MIGGTLIGWFGARPRWADPDDTPDPVPVGVSCLYCGEAIAAGNSGSLYTSGQAIHYACELRSVVGSVAHQQRRCSCYGGTAPHLEPGQTRYQAALAAALYFHKTKPLHDDEIK